MLTRPNATTLIYRNAQDGTFDDVTDALAMEIIPGANGVALADLDNDGDQDVVITVIGWGKPQVFENRWPEPFRRRPMSAGLATDQIQFRSGYGVALGDFDLDGRVDMFVTEWIGPTQCGESHARLYRNITGDAGTDGIQFEDVTDRAGVTLERADNPVAWSFGGGFADFDEDGWPDLLVTADARTSRLFFGSEAGRFVDATAAAGVGTEHNGMGSTIADFDGDGRLDIFVSAITPERSNPQGGHRLYLYAGERRFEDQTDAAGLRFGGWGWGVSAIDGDHDGDLDIVMTTGLPGAQSAVDPIRYWRNNGDGTYDDIAQDVGLLDTEPGMGLAVFDYDRDGDQDVVMVRNGRTPLLYRNDGGVALGDYLRVRTRGVRGNRDGLGSVVWVGVGEQEWVGQTSSVSHFLGQSERVAHFGLGTSAQARTATVRVRFLGGHEVVLNDVALNQEIVVSEPDAPAPLGPAVVPATPLDCNADGEPDVCAPDCDSDGVPDSCQLAEGSAPDCNGNLVIDSCEVRSGLASDCDASGRLDECEIRDMPALDCNGDGWLDRCAGTVCPAVDAGVEPVDGGAGDGGREDASVTDAGRSDAGGTRDLGMAVDLGVDAGGGLADAGQGADLGAMSGGGVLGGGCSAVEGGGGSGWGLVLMVLLLWGTLGNRPTLWGTVRGPVYSVQGFEPSGRRLRGSNRPTSK